MSCAKSPLLMNNTVMLLHGDFFKKFNYKDNKPRAIVPASATADELQEIVSQSIWGKNKTKHILTLCPFSLLSSISRSHQNNNNNNNLTQNGE